MRSDLDLLRAYEPVVRFNEGELFFPASVEDYVACCTLLERVRGEDPRVVLDQGEVTLERLTEVDAQRSGPGLYLRFVDEPFSRLASMRWRRRSDRPRFRHADRLARVGVLSRIIDALMRVSLFFRGTVARGTEAAAETQYREQMRADHHPYYGRVVRSAGYVALQYWFFYAFNDWRSRVYGVNDHEADWEQVVVYLAERADGSLQPSWVVFSAHDESGDDLRRRWDDPDLDLVGEHPVVFAGIGSHSGAYVRGEYLTTFDPPAFPRVVRALRSVTRTLLPWTRNQPDAGVGVPYVDYARGDGLSIGPAQDREWSPMIIDDDTTWVVDYRGLWGNDTADPLGGERGPAGPRYERSTEVRHSWGDVIGWSGLAKVAPNAEVAVELVGRRLEELSIESRAVDGEIEAERTALRADVASGVAVPPSREQHLDELVSRRVGLHDEGRRLGARLSNPPPTPGPHDHLHHRRLPTDDDTRARRRVLSIWSALSTPVILGVLALLFIPGLSTPVLSTIVTWLFVLLLVEALARRNLFNFLATLAVIVIVVLAVIAIGGLAFASGWQTPVAVCLSAFAFDQLVVNLRELTLA
ncbi:MAG: hypothetical protein QNM02_19730 [Acidimicrobiia bacterium]|nr:hypothetical protein [Acidimicrobiia bacterium]